MENENKKNEKLNEEKSIFRNYQEENFKNVDELSVMEEKNQNIDDNSSLSEDDVMRQLNEKLNSIQMAQSETVISPELIKKRWKQADIHEGEIESLKKYVFYISKDYIQYFEDKTLDEKTAFINDAIEKKVTFENKIRKKEKAINVSIHFMLLIFIIIITMPICLITAHKAIIATFNNYKYSQDNFEKLYRHKLEQAKYSKKMNNYKKLKY